MADGTLPSPDNDVSFESKQKGFGHFWAELKRRKIFRVTLTYAVVAWVIIQIASTTFADFGIPVWAFRFVVLCVVLGFPIVLVITWAFELTPDGIRTTRSVRKDQNEPKYQPEHHRKRNLMAYGLGAAVPALIFGFLALFFYIQTRSLVTQIEVSNQVEEIDKSIAVLPFDNRSKLEDDQYFTDGIHDDLLTQISMIKDIKTISRTSVMAYKDTTKNLKAIGEELGVATILEGGVQRAGNMVRINAQLIDAATDAHLWAKTYDRELTAENIFRIQSEIAMAIADALKAVLSPDEKGDLERLPTQNLDALEVYFQAVASRGRGNMERSIELLERAISLDPDFADAYADLGRQILNLGRTQGWPIEELYSQVQTLIDTALALDPRNAIAYRTIGRLNTEKRKFKEAEEAFSKAIELRPSYGEAYANYAEILGRQGKIDESFEIMKRGLKVDPHSRFLKEKHINLLYRIGQTEEADALFDNYLEEYQDDFSFGFVVLSYGRQMKYDQAVKVLRQWHHEDSKNQNVPIKLSLFYHDLGDEENADFWTKRWLLLVSGGEISPNQQLHALIVSEKWQEAEALFAKESSQSNSSSLGSALSYWMLEDIKQGRTNAPMVRYKYLFPKFFEEGYKIEDEDNKWAVKDIAISMRAAGMNERASDLFANLISNMEEAQDEELLVNLYAITGDLESAMSIIRKGDPLIYARRYNDYNLINLQGYPEYEAFIKDAKQELEKQRKRLAEWEANGELAPIPLLPVK